MKVFVSGEGEEDWYESVRFEKENRIFILRKSSVERVFGSPLAGSSKISRLRICGIFFRRSVSDRNAPLTGSAPARQTPLSVLPEGSNRMVNRTPWSPASQSAWMTRPTGFGLYPGRRSRNRMIYWVAERILSRPPAAIVPVACTANS